MAYGEAPVVHTALKYNLDFPWVMSFHFLPLLPRLVAMVECFLCVKEE